MGSSVFKVLHSVSMNLSDMLTLILYRDENIIVLNKPSGIAVHRTSKGDPSLEDGFAQLQFGQKRNPALAHRLDKLTSGCLVLGRNAGALTRLGKLFASGKIRKRYLALVIGGPKESKGVISIPITRVDLGRGKWEFRCDATGQEAITHYEVLKASATHSLLSLTPITGRTHQLRLHCQAMGCSIMGDIFYGGGEGPLMLHAFQVMIPTGSGCARVDVNAPLPDYMAQALAQHSMSIPAPMAWE